MQHHCNSFNFVCQAHRQQADLICQSPNCPYFFLCHFCTLEDLNHAISHKKHLIDSSNFFNCNIDNNQKSRLLDIANRQILTRKYKIQSILNLQYKKTINLLRKQFDKLEQQLNQQYHEQSIKLEQILAYYSTVLKNQQLMNNDNHGSLISK